MIFKPHEDIQQIPKGFRKRWAEALMSSKQAKDVMYDPKTRGDCCLMVAERLNGNSPRNFLKNSKGEMPAGKFKAPYRTPEGELLQDLMLAQHSLSGEEGDCIYYLPSYLNDVLLNHKQIAALLRGETVEIPDE